jgi:ubiquinone/menaquinone biosynthesis C-methylase UbiE
MNPAFDSIAEEYDAKFTQTKIGRAQRDIVWTYLKNALNEKKSLRILELNCGTGEDALWFANKGHTVIATDISEKMLEVTEQKALQNRLDEKIETKKIDLTKIEGSNLNGKFDLIFSNFGGINCVSFRNLYNLPAIFAKSLNPSGRLIMVVMPTFCLWEMLYFTIRLNLLKAFRRSSTKGVKINLNGSEIIVNYYTPILVRKIFEKEFFQAAVKPVGFFIPPSYLEKFFSSKDKTLSFIKKLEACITNWSILSNYSDHFLIDLVKK